MEIPSLVQSAQKKDTRALGRLVTAIENNPTAARTISSQITGITSTDTQIIGVTGAPGVGKSTCVAALILAFRSVGQRVAVLAVDPSSPFTRGALLGDRVRMQQFATDPDVYIRSMATRGHLGGLAVAAPATIRLMKAVGFDIVIVETVGIGQGEVEIAALADTTLLLLAPQMGDGIQAAKAGVVEIADIFVVNKADHDGAAATVRDLKNMLALGGKHSHPGTWRPRIVSTAATRATHGGRNTASGPVDEGGSGLDDLLAAIDKHRTWQSTHGELTTLRKARARAEIEAIVAEEAQRLLDPTQLESYAKAVAVGELDPYVAAERLTTMDTTPGQHDELSR